MSHAIRITEVQTYEESLPPYAYEARRAACGWHEHGGRVSDGRFKLICRQHQFGRCACPLRYQAVICWALPSGDCVPLCNQCSRDKPRHALAAGASTEGDRRE